LVHVADQISGTHFLVEAGATFSIIHYFSSLPASDLNLSTISSSNEVTASAIVSSAVPGPQAVSGPLGQAASSP
jgi:hypothetical protein